MQVPFNKPHIIGNEASFVQDVITSGQLGGNGKYTKLCQSFFEDQYGFKKSLFTTSCTDALEMAALLADINPGDEVIVPAYTYVSSVNAFVLRGATPVFIDSQDDNPNLDINTLEDAITSKTKVIVVVHYNGVSCDMNSIMSIAEKHNIMVVEDAAQAINSKADYGYVGTKGHMSAFSFHDTKNIICGEGGMLCITDEKLIERAEIIWEKGTNRAAFKRGEVTEYSWIDKGSSFYPSELVAAFLWGQLQELDNIQNRRSELWQNYYNQLKYIADDGNFIVPEQEGNAHVFYIVLGDKESRDALTTYLKQKDISAVFHYLALHQSPYFIDKYIGKPLPNSIKFTNCLLRLPLHNSMTNKEQDYVVQAIKEYYR